MRLEKLIDHFGSQTRMAKALNVTQGAVHHWVNADALPPLRAIEIERITFGKFRASDLVEGAGDGDGK